MTQQTGLNAPKLAPPRCSVPQVIYRG